MALRASAARVKSNRSYTIEEAAETVGVTQQTVRSWIKQGLPAMTDQRPFLIIGLALKDFMKETHQKRKQPLSIGEFFCVRCKVPRKAAAGMVFYSPLSGSHGRLEALCAVCEGVCQRTVRAEDLRHWTPFCRIDGSTDRNAYRNPSTSPEIITSGQEGRHAEIQRG